jgi:uncharacterized membrane protein YheB (UPF0754 family)
MQTFLLILRYIAGPVLGALIGYFTNWLAVKMLFRPYYPKKIGKFTLPFTPGIIPKRKKDIARAVGKAVGEQLFTTDDIKNAVLGGDVKQKVCDGLVSAVYDVGDKSVEEVAKNAVGDSGYAGLVGKATDVLTDKIMSAVERADVGGLVAEQGGRVIREKRSNLGMLSMFLTDELIQNVLEKVGQGVNDYVSAYGREFIQGKVDEELKNITASSAKCVTEQIDRETLKNIVEKVYDKVAGVAVDNLVEGVDISGIVEGKIAQMDVKDLEKLVLSVMKKELTAIVNLGAVIGFILGIVMIFV